MNMPVALNQSRHWCSMVCYRPRHVRGPQIWTWLRDNPRYLAFRRDVSDPTSSHERALRRHNRQLELVEANSVPPGLGVSQHEVPRTLLNHHFYP